MEPNLAAHKDFLSEAQLYFLAYVEAMLLQLAAVARFYPALLVLGDGGL